MCLKVCNDLTTQDPKHAEVKVLKDRLVVLNDTDAALAEIFKFNEELAEFDKVLTTLQSWVDGKAAVGEKKISIWASATTVLNF